VRLRDVDRDGRLDFDLDGDGDVDQWDIRQVTLADARRLYREDYWSLSSSGFRATCADFPRPVAICLFDAAVLSGPRRAVALLQRALYVRSDGLVGPATIAAARGVERARLVARYQAERIRFYSSLNHAHAPAFMLGWAKRTHECALYACGALELREETLRRLA
jgi:lysozyme family protein